MIWSCPTCGRFTIELKADLNKRRQRGRYLDSVESDLIIRFELIQEMQDRVECRSIEDRGIWE